MSSCQNLHCPDREFRAADADFSNLKSQRRPRQSVTFNSETAIAELLTSTSTANFVIGFLLLSSRFTEAVARLFKKKIYCPDREFRDAEAGFFSN